MGLGRTVYWAGRVVELQVQMGGSLSSFVGRER